MIQDRAFVTEAQELIGGTGRWALRWVPENPGTYFVSLEVVDDDGDVTFIPFDSEVVILPKLTSKVPDIRLITEYDGQAFTSKSKLRFIAFAEDLDGKLEGVQFYVDGEPLGEEIKSNLSLIHI